MELRKCYNNPLYHIVFYMLFTRHRRTGKFDEVTEYKLFWAWD